MVSMRSSIIQQEIQMDEKQINLLNVVARKSLLFCIVTLGLISIFVTSIIAYLDPSSIWLFGVLPDWTFYVCDITCNLLLFTMNKQWYYKICYGCDNGCRRICQYLAQRSMRKASKYDGHDLEYTRL